MVATTEGGGQRMKQGSKVQVTQNAPDCAVFAGQSGENDLLVWFRADELAEVR